MNRRDKRRALFGNNKGKTPIVLPSQKASRAPVSNIIDFKETFGIGYKFIEFMNEMEGLYLTAAPLSIVPQVAKEVASKRLEDLKEQNKVQITNAVGGKSYHFTGENLTEVTLALMQEEKYDKFQHSLPRVFPILIVTIFESYLYNLLLDVLKNQPQIMNGCIRNIIFEELESFQNIEDIKNTYIEQEVESILSENQLEKFSWFQKRGIDVNNIPYRDEVYEVILRRNLMAHSRGVINKRYIEGINKYKINTSNIPDLQKGPQLGASLTFNRPYHERCHLGFLVYTMMLSQLVLRNVLKLKDVADRLAVNGVYYLITYGRYQIAIEILESILKFFPDLQYDKQGLLLKINLANSYRLLGNKTKVSEILGGDWSAYADYLKFAREIVLENYPNALALMDNVGKSFREGDYSNWPIFNGFRETKEFQDKFKQLFGKPFTPAPIIKQGAMGATYMDVGNTEELIAALKNILPPEVDISIQE